MPGRLWTAGSLTVACGSFFDELHRSRSVGCAVQRVNFRVADYLPHVPRAIFCGRLSARRLNEDSLMTGVSTSQNEIFSSCGDRIQLLFTKACIKMEH